MDTSKQFVRTVYKIAAQLVEMLDGQNPTVVMNYPACTECKTKESAFWHRTGSNSDVVCNVCHDSRRDGAVTRTLRSQGLQSTPAGGATAVVESPGGRGVDDAPDSVGSGFSRALVNNTRKSNRLKPVMIKTRTVQNATKLSSVKGRSRKAVLKKNPLKAPVAVSSVVPSDYIFSEGHYWQIGDVVSVVDEDDGLTYFAQLKGFLQDQYCGKSAVITWLIPLSDVVDGHWNTASSTEQFNPKQYIAGPEEDLPRDMAHFEFVCHAPSDFFLHRSPYCSRVVNPPSTGCVWTRFGPEIQTVNEPANDGDSLPMSGDTMDTSGARSMRSDVDHRPDRELGRRASLNKDSKGQSNKSASSRFK